MTLHDMERETKRIGSAFGQIFGMMVIMIIIMITQITVTDEFLLFTHIIILGKCKY
jgi:hypothetical protein